MNWNKAIRQVHRGLSMALTLGVIGYMIVMTRGQPAAWVGLFALVPLILLLLSGLYLFALPHVVRWRRTSVNTGSEMQP